MFLRNKSVKVPVVKLKSGLVKKDITFPATTKSLWNPEKQGSMIPIHFANYRNPQIQLTERAVILANRHASQSKEKIYRCFLIGHCLLNTDDEGITLIIDRFDPGSSTPGRNDFIPTTLLPGDFAVPLTISQSSPDYFPTHSSQDIIHSAKLIEHLVCSKEKLALGRLLPLRAHCTCYDHHDHVTVALTISSVTVSNGYELNAVTPVPILPTALARNLSGPLSLSEIQKTHKMGYLTMDQTRKLLLMIETDSKVSTLPIVGLWLSGVLSVYSPHTWAACLRFMHNNSIQQRILSETGCFLLVLYSPTASQPFFYQCLPLEEDVSFQLYECHENLHCMKNFKKSPVLLELSPAKDGPQQATFVDAMQKFKPQRSSKVTPLSKSGMIRPVAEIEEPKPLPSPKPLLHQNASLKPAVPELSVLFDSFDESLSKHSPIQLQQLSSAGRQPNKHISPHNTSHIQQYHPMHKTSITSGNPQYKRTSSSLGYQNSSSGHPQGYSVPQPTSSVSGISAVHPHSDSRKRYSVPQPMFAHHQNSSSGPQMTSPGSSVSVGYPHNSSGYQRNYLGNPPVSLGNPLQVFSEPRIPYQDTPMSSKRPSSTPHLTGSVAGNGMPITDTPHYPMMEMKSKMMLGRSSSINYPVHQCHSAPVMNTGGANITSEIPGHLHTNRPDKRRMSEQSYNTSSVKEHRRLSAPSNIDCPCPHQQCLHSPQPSTPNAPPNGGNYSNMPHNIMYQSADGKSSSIRAGVSQNIQTARHDPDTGIGESIDHSTLPFGSNYQNSSDRAHEQIQTPVQQQVHQNHQLLPTPSTTGNQLHNSSYQGVHTELCSPGSQQVLQQQYPLLHQTSTGHHFSNNSNRVHTEFSENCQRHQQLPTPVQNNDVRDLSASSPSQHNSPEMSKMVSNQSYPSNQKDRNKAAAQPGPDEHTLQQLKRQEELIKNLQAQVQSLLLAQAASQVATPLTPPATPMHQPQSQTQQTPAKSDRSPTLVKKTMCNISVNTGTSLCWPNTAGVSPVKDGGLAVPEGQSRKEFISTETTPSDNPTSKLKTSDREQIPTSNKENKYSTLNNSDREHKNSLVESIKNGNDLSARDSSATNLDDTLPDPQIQNDTRSLASSVLAVDLQSFNGSTVEQVSTPERRGDVLTNSIISPVLGESASMLVRKPGAFVEGSVLHQADSLLYKDEAKFYDNLLGKVKKMLQGSESAETAQENKDDEQHVKDYVDSTDDEADEDTDSEVEEGCENIDEIIPSSGQSMYLSTVFPKIIDVSMIDLSMDSSNLSMEANAIAMKYLDDQQLSAMSEAFKATKDPLVRTAMLNRLTDKSSVDISTGGATNFSFASMKYLEKYGLLDTSMNLNKKHRKAKGKKIKKKPKERKVEKRKREETTEDEYSIVTQDSMVEPFKFSPANKEQMPSTPKPILVFGNRKQDLKNSHAKNISWNIGNTSSPRAPLQTITNKAETGTTQGMKVDNGVTNVLDVNRLKQLPKLL